MLIDMIDNAERETLAVNFISWTRLVSQLRAAGEVNDAETIARFHITPRGIEYHVTDRATHPQLV